MGSHVDRWWPVGLDRRRGRGVVILLDLLWWVKGVSLWFRDLGHRAVSD